MDLASMLLRVRTGLDDRASDYTDSQLIASMQLIWMWDLPHKIDGHFGEDWHNIALTAGNRVYPIDSPATWGYSGALLVPERLWYVGANPLPLTIYTDRLSYDQSKVPLSVLWQDRAFTFWTVPTGGENVTVQGRYSAGGFNANSGDPANNGIVNDVRALAVVRGAVLDVATQEGWTELVEEYAAYYEASIRTLRAISMAQPYQYAARPDL